MSTASAPVLPPPLDFSKRLFTVGVTGTNGKTTTCAWIAAALGVLQRPVVRATTVGYFLDEECIDLPMDFAGFAKAMARCVDRGGRYASIELTSEALLLGFAKTWPCTVGVFTNLTHDHLDAHGSPEHYLASKAQLFLKLPSGGTAVFNGCDPASELLEQVLPSGVRVLRYGAPTRGEAYAPLDVQSTRIALDWSGTSIDMVVGGAIVDAPTTLRVRAIGHIFAENALAAWVGAIAAGVPAKAAATALSAAATPPGRFEVVAERPYVVVDYAHTPDALARTVKTACALKKGALTVVFGAGGGRDKKKRGPMGQAARGADHVIVTSDNPRKEQASDIAAAITEGLRGHPSVRVQLDRARAIEQAVLAARDDDVVLICGKGHEQEQLIGDERRPFSDRDVGRAAHEKRAEQRRR